MLTVGVLCPPAPAQAQALATHWPADPPAAIAFDLPAQPLKKALAQYDAQTSLSVFYPSALAEGKSSGAVHGVFSPAQALRQLLDGTGLSVQAVAQDAFVLVPEASGASAFAPAMRGEASGEVRDAMSDAERVQSRVFEALCAAPGVSLGGYRLALRVHIGEEGRVRDVRLLDSTGNRTRDAAIAVALRGLDIGRAPADTATPFVLLVRPRPAGSPSVCAGAPTAASGVLH